MADDDKAEAKTVPMEQFQKLQRELEKSRNQARENALSRFDIEEMRARQDESDTLLKGLVSGEQVDADDQDSVLGKVAAARKGRESATAARARLTDLSIEHGVDWSDPQLEQARTLYDAGQYEQAISVAEKALAPESGKDGTELKAAVQEALKELGHVDQGGSQASGEIPSDSDAVTARLQQEDGPAYFHENRKAILDQLRKR